MNQVEFFIKEVKRLEKLINAQQEAMAAMWKVSQDTRLQQLDMDKKLREVCIQVSNIKTSH